MIYILKTENTHTTVDCNQQAGQLFLGNDHAQWNRRRKLWIIEPAHVPSLIARLRATGHTVVIDDDDRTPPQPPLWQQPPIDWDQQTATNTLGAAAARAALRHAQDQP